MVNRIRIRTWHLFALVTCVALAMWLVTQVGVTTGEIEVLQFDAWPGNVSSARNSRIEISGIKFKYVAPEDLSNTNLSLFFADPTFIEFKNIEVGSRIRFRYRTKSMLWLRATHPDPIAIQSLGINPDDVAEIITSIELVAETGD